MTTNNNKRWTEEDDRQLDTMLNQGMSYKAIARALGRTQYAVTERRIRQGMPTPTARVRLAAEMERARIVACLRGETGCAWSRDVIAAADAIERLEHWK